MKKLIGVLVILVLTLIPESCLKQPPSVEDVESFVKKNWNEIVIINDYLLGLENRDASISYADGSIFIDSANGQIEDDSVRGAIQSLWKEGCTSIYKSIYGDVSNAIDYCIWTRLGECCGFVYAIDHTRPPELEYPTELVPLSIEGWYYYVENYEKWRENND